MAILDAPEFLNLTIATEGKKSSSDKSHVSNLTNIFYFLLSFGVEILIMLNIGIVW